MQSVVQIHLARGSMEAMDPASIVDKVLRMRDAGGYAGVEFESWDKLSYSVVVFDEIASIFRTYDSPSQPPEEIWSYRIPRDSPVAKEQLKGAVLSVQTAVTCQRHSGPLTSCCIELESARQQILELEGQLALKLEQP